MINTKNLLSARNAVPLGGLAILLIIPLFVTSNYHISILITCMAFSVFAVAWNIIGGYGNQVSWASSAFVAIGAYTNFILGAGGPFAFEVSPFVSLPLGMVLSYIMATIIGYGSFRLRGAYFAIATIAFAEAFRSAIQFFSDFTRGTIGLFVPYRGNNFWGLSFSNDRPFYYIFVILLVLSLVFCNWFVKSKTGYYLSCIKGDEDAAQSLGIETFKIKLRAFQVSAVMMAVAGAFYASFLTFISPASTASFNLSIMIGIAAIIGGTGTLWGPVLGAFIIVPLIEIAGIWLGASGASNVLYGLLLVVMVMYRPQGLITVFYALGDKIQKNRKNAAAAKGE